MCKKNAFVLFVSFCLLCLAGCNSKSGATYLDHTKNPDERAADLVSRMTLEEKASQLGNRSPEIERLGIAEYEYWNEALHGVARAGIATVFPQVIGLSSTWDPDLVHRMATATSDEARVKNNVDGKGLTYWSPTVNMSRDPRWGRAEESYGEDPHLASKLSVEFIKGMQGDHPDYLKTIATLKHYAANNTEFNRHESNSVVGMRDLLEYYLPVFKVGVMEGNVHSVMSAYNAVNGVPASASNTLLQDILRERWGFDGFVVTDCGAIYDILANHEYVDTPEEAVAISLRAGADLNCSLDHGFSPRNRTGDCLDCVLQSDSKRGMYQQFVLNAIEKGLITEADIDVNLKRIFRARILLGEFDPPSMVPYTQIHDSILDCQAHKDLALETALKSMVLLKNENNFLPLNQDHIKTIAMIGSNADKLIYGGYSGTPSDPVSPIGGIAARFGVEYRGHTPLLDVNDYSQIEGLRADPNQMGWLSYITDNSYVLYEGVPFNNERVLELSASSGTSGGRVEVRLDALDGRLLAEYNVPNTGGWNSWNSFSKEVEPLSGKYDVYIRFVGTGEDAYLLNLQSLSFPPEQDVNNDKILFARGTSTTGDLNQEEVDQAVNYARNSDVAIVVVGSDLAVADEGYDRNTLDLTGSQEALIKAVYEANPNTVVVLVTGFPVSINWTNENVPAILTAWYGGQSQGTAIADILFGDYNPGGKLTSTWYKSADDLPEFTDYDIIKNNRTYMYFEGDVLYPFGYGLSYTDFGYSQLELSADRISEGEKIVIKADIQNAGSYVGDEVAQLYVRDMGASVKRPLKQLMGFERITLKPGETKTVSFELPYSELGFYDESTGNFIVEDGEFEIMIGSSSQDIRLRTKISASAGITSDIYFGLE